MKKSVILLLALFLSCSNVNKERMDKYKLPPYKPNVVVTNHHDSTIVTINYISISKNRNAKSEFISSINGFEVKIRLGDKLVRSMTMKPVRIVKPFNDNLMTYAVFSSGIFIIENTNIRIDQLAIEIIIGTNNSYYSYKKYISDLSEDFNTDHASIMTMYPVIERIDTSQIAIGCFCKRTDFMKDEYLPSSEDFRAELRSRKGVLIWSSNYNMNYTMQIGKVQPENVDDVNLYLINWDYIGNNGKKIVTGDYGLKLIIPAKPTPYYVLTELKVDYEYRRR